ncbi:hypothetical protein V1522DRAFT_417143 [Lipomyces starkeyi]
MRSVDVIDELVDSMGDNLGEFPNEWIEKRNKKKRFIDREIRCTLVNKDTGKPCNWSTTDSKRQTSTTSI